MKPQPLTSLLDSKPTSKESKLSNLELCRWGLTRGYAFLLVPCLLEPFMETSTRNRLKASDLHLCRSLTYFWPAEPPKIPHKNTKTSEPRLGFAFQKPRKHSKSHPQKANKGARGSPKITFAKPNRPSKTTNSTPPPPRSLALLQTSNEYDSHVVRKSSSPLS